MTRLNPRIVQHDNGTASLVGISLIDLNHILTLASLQQYEVTKDFKTRTVPQKTQEAVEAERRGTEGALFARVVRQNIQQEAAYHHRIRTIIEMAESSVNRSKRAINRIANLSYRNCQYHEIVQRRETVLLRRSLRETFRARRTPIPA